MAEPVHSPGSQPYSASRDIKANSIDNGTKYSQEDVTGETVQVVDPAAERALCRKFDFRLLPVLAIMYLFNALDKGNLGNAQTAGLSTDLKFGPGQYNLIVGIFFVPYVLVAATRNFGGLFALRFLLGAVESGFFPLVIFYLTTFYRRDELARRLGIFYAASNISSAFSGLLAFGVFQIKSHLIDHPWRWLFIIEGVLTLLFAIFAFFYLPKSAAEATFLTEEEKALAYHRIQVDSSAVVNEEFNLRESLKIFKRPTTYGFLLIEIALGVPIQSVALFLPQIVQRIVTDTVKVNLFTVAPNITGAVTLLILAFSSDFLRIRFPFICLGFALTFIGFIIYAAIDVVNQTQVAYFATFMMTWGTSAPSVLLSTWYNNNIAHEGQRLALTSVGVPLANLMGLVSSNVFRAQDAPRYELALITTASFGAFGLLVTAFLGLYMWFDNRRRNQKQGVKLHARDVPTSQMRDGPKGADFRWFL